MERLYHVHIERMPEGRYVATSDEIQGLVAEGRTVHETMELARDAAQRLIEVDACDCAGDRLGDSFDLPLVVGE